MDNPNFEAIGPVSQRKPLVRSRSTGSNIEATDRLMTAAGARFVGALMLSERALWGLTAGLTVALTATPMLATDSTKLQSIRASLSTEKVIAFAASKSTTPILDIDNTIEINIVLNAKNMRRGDVQSWQLQFLRLFSAVGVYVDVRINLDAGRSIDYAPTVPYDPFKSQNELTSTQTFNVFVDRDALKLAKVGQIAVHDVDTLRSMPDGAECYVEHRKGYPLLNVVVDRDLNPIGCLYGVLLQSIGITDAFGGVAETFRTEAIPGFRLNAEMAAAYAIRECRSVVGKKDQLEKCLRGVLENGK